MLKDIIEQGLIEARGIVGFYPANTVDDDDIELYEDQSRNKVVCKLHTLR